MKDHVEIGHLTKYDAFRMNRDQVMDLEIWFKIHTNVYNFETEFPKIILMMIMIMTMIINIYIAHIPREYDQMRVTNKYDTNQT